MLNNCNSTTKTTTTKLHNISFFRQKTKERKTKTKIEAKTTFDFIELIEGVELLFRHKIFYALL